MVVPERQPVIHSHWQELSEVALLAMAPLFLGKPDGEGGGPEGDGPLAIPCTAWF